jgi:hypothetical protein
MPWNYIDTFGKQPYNNSSGQAHLCQWPLKLKLISSVSPYFHKAHLMLSADCAAFSVNNFTTACFETAYCSSAVLSLTALTM